MGAEGGGGKNFTNKILCEAGKAPHVVGYWEQLRYSWLCTLLHRLLALLFPAIHHFSQP
jgi:hypothetical protein